MTREETYRRQMKELGIYNEIFEPEIKTLAQVEREKTMAKKAWSKTAPPGGKPSVLDDHYAVIQKLRAEELQHRQALGLTPQALRKLTGVNAGADAPVQQDLITAKLDAIAEKVAGYDLPADGGQDNVWTGIEAAAAAEAIGDMMDQQDDGKLVHRMDADLRHAVAEDMG